MVVGFDREFNFMKLIKACSYLHKPDCLFIATNEDANLPIKSDTIVVPGKYPYVHICSHVQDIRSVYP